MTEETKKIDSNHQNVKYDDFLQSTEWREFQQFVGRKTFHLGNDVFSASIIEHSLPIVGTYFYCPRGPIVEIPNSKFQISNDKDVNNIKIDFSELMNLAKKNNAGWIRIEPASEEVLEIIRESISEKIVKAPHDMQPREIFVLDISKSEETLLSEMKPKTRYNINLAKKKGVVISNWSSDIKEQKNEKYVTAFLRLTKEMALRNGITAHPENYYRKMIENLPADMLKIYVAEYEGEIIAANLVLFYKNTVVYLHGASGNTHRNVMAPFLMQWQAIVDAKEKGCKSYDFGGVKTTVNGQQASGSWEGITNFKLGFSPATKPIEFPGSYDIVVNSRAYALYRGLQSAKEFAYRFRK